MVATPFIRRIAKAAAAAGAAFLAVAATPAIANSSAAAVDMAAPVQEAQGSTIGGAVTALGDKFVTVKNQAGIAVIRVDSIDAVAGAITLK